MEFSTYSTEELIISSESKKEIYKMIQSLDNTTREVMYLRFTGDLSFREIGEILNKTENWARVTFFRGKSKIIRSMKLVYLLVKQILMTLYLNCYCSLLF